VAAGHHHTFAAHQTEGDSRLVKGGWDPTGSDGIPQDLTGIPTGSDGIPQDLMGSHRV